MQLRRLFPLGKAYGEAFCNRTEEANKLTEHVNNGKHVFLVAPRRYGKSSLCEKVFELSNLPAVKLDFHLVTDDKDAERIIINGTIDLIGKTIGSIEKHINLVKKYVKKLKPKLAVNVKALSLELELDTQVSPAENIAEALLLIDKLLRERKKQAIMLFDEFQEIGEISNGRALEGAIRHAAQEMQNLAIIFSGSNPHLLQNMFEDDRRPLYKLCRKIVLNRIESEHYKKHLNKAAKKAWKKELDEDIHSRIIELSERHPYYVNYLCDELWSNAKPPTLKTVDEAWNNIVEEERSDLLKDFFALSENQKKIMIYIANHGGENIYSNEATKLMDVSASSITRALSVLLEKDFVEKINNEYRFIVPVYKKLLERK